MCYIATSPSDQLEEAELVALTRRYVAAVKARQIAPELWYDILGVRLTIL